MRFLMVCIALLALSNIALADENIFNSTKALKEQTMRVGDEALELVKTPLDTDGYGFVGTLAVTGAVGLTYLFDDDIRNKLQGSKSRGMDKATDVGSLIGNPFLHIGIAATMQLGIFPWAMLALYPSFFHPEEYARTPLLRRLRTSRGWR